MAAKRKLPTGIQTFRTLREAGCYYVDKTGYLTIPAAIDDEDEPRYRLTYPNHEVRQSFNRNLNQPTY